MALAISMIFGAQGAMAVDVIGQVNIDQVTGLAGANRENITFKPTGAAAIDTVYINQAGSGSLNSVSLSE